MMVLNSRITFVVLRDISDDSCKVLQVTGLLLVVLKF